MGGIISIALFFLTIASITMAGLAIYKVNHLPAPSGGGGGATYPVLDTVFGITSTTGDPAELEFNTQGVGTGKKVTIFPNGGGADDTLQIPPITGGNDTMVLTDAQQTLKLKTLQLPRLTTFRSERQNTLIGTVINGTSLSPTVTITGSNNIGIIQVTIGGTGTYTIQIAFSSPGFNDFANPQIPIVVVVPFSSSINDTDFGTYRVNPGDPTTTDFRITGDISGTAIPGPTYAFRYICM